MTSVKSQEPARIRSHRHPGARGSSGENSRSPPQHPPARRTFLSKHFQSFPSSLRLSPPGRGFSPPPPMKQGQSESMNHDMKGSHPAPPCVFIGSAFPSEQTCPWHDTKSSNPRARSVSKSSLAGGRSRVPLARFTPCLFRLPPHMGCGSRL